MLRFHKGMKQSNPITFLMKGKGVDALWGGSALGQALGLFRVGLIHIRSSCTACYGLIFTV